MTTCTISILSWKRVDNINRLISTYNFYSCVSDIIVWNNNPACLLSDLGLPKVKVVNCSRDMGLDSRFASASLADSRCVITHDDDLILSEMNILNFIKHWEMDYSRVYSYEGRIIINGKYSYEPGPQRIEKVTEPTEVDVVLTRTTCFDRLLAAEYMRWSDAIFYDVERNLNGEDIALSYISRRIFGKCPIVLPVVDPQGYEELPANDKISVRTGFLERRSQVAQRCDLMFPRVKAPSLDENGDREKIIMFGPGNYPVGTHPATWLMNGTFKKFVIEDCQDGKVMWIEAESNVDYMIGIIAFSNNWTTVKLDLNDKIRMKTMNFGDEINVDVQLIFSPLKGNKEVHSGIVCLKEFQNDDRIMELSIPVERFLEDNEHKELFKAGMTQSVKITCHCRTMKFELRILEMKVVG